MLKQQPHHASQEPARDVVNMKKSAAATRI